jgi:RNA polymerase sigma-54 factor
VRFANAFVNSGVFGPSRMSYYTGRYPITHGATWNRVPLSVGEVKLGEMLRASGRSLALAGKSHVMPDRDGLARLQLEGQNELVTLLERGSFEEIDRYDGHHTPGSESPVGSGLHPSAAQDGVRPAMRAVASWPCQPVGATADPQADDRSGARCFRRRCMSAMEFRVEARQQQAMSPKLQHAVRLLQLSSQDFAREVTQALGRNPFLEVEDAEDDDEQFSSGDDAAPANDDSEHVALESSESSESHNDGDSELWQADTLGRQSHTGHAEFGALDTMAAQVSLAHHLHEQLTAQALPARDRLLAQIIIESLDDDGYLRTPLDELRLLADLAAAPDLAEMALALQRVQALEPAGVAARDVGECLRLQLPSIADADLREVAEAIIDEHLALLASRDVAALARMLRRTPTEIEAVCDRIRHLDPRPGWRHGASDTQYVVPDVIARKRRGAWTVQLNPAVVPRVKLNKVYAELFQRCRRDDRAAAPSGAEPHGELACHLQDARWTVRNVEQRFSTILDVSQAIVRRQRHFFDFGSMAMKPLALRDIAEELGMHESTVSRVTNNKFIATPLGVFELKHFFSRAMVTASGSACSGTAIRGLIEDMIDAEAAQAPLSDAEIARQLARQGLKVARRTVTKYRQLLRIESVERRRRQA